MGKLKSFYHDEISDRDPPSPSFPPFPLDGDVAVDAFPMPPVHVVMERNAITGDCVPVIVCNNLFDAQSVMLMRNAGRYLTNDAESVDYFIVEAVPCLG